jgi:hypothetical protein
MRTLVCRQCGKEIRRNKKLNPINSQFSQVLIFSVASMFLYGSSVKENYTEVHREAIEAPERIFMYYSGEEAENIYICFFNLFNLKNHEN